MYSFYEIRKIFSRCKDFSELDQACEAFRILIEDGEMSEEQEKFTRRESIVRLRQLKV